MSTDATPTQHRGSRRKVFWDSPDGKVEITERQLEIMDLWHKFDSDSNVTNVAQAVANELGISANAVYVARRRVKEAIEQTTAIDKINNGRTTLGKPRRVVPLAQYRREHEGVSVDEEIQEVAAVAQQKLITLAEQEEYFTAELEKIAKAKEGLLRMISSVLDGEEPDENEGSDGDAA